MKWKQVFDPAEMPNWWFYASAILAALILTSPLIIMSIRTLLEAER